MSIRDNLDISAYLVLGPENTLGRPVGDVVAQPRRVPPLPMALWSRCLRWSA